MATWLSGFDPKPRWAAFFAPYARARSRAGSPGPCRGAGYTANRSAHRVEPRLGLMPPAGCSRFSAPPGGDAPHVLAPFPGDVRRYVCHHFELRSNRSSVAPAGRACRPCSDRLFAVVRHLASERGALHWDVVRHVESGRRSDGIMRLAHYVLE